MRTLKQWIYRWVERRFLSGCSSYNDLDVRKSCRSKRQAREVFAANNIPHAPGTTFLWPWTALRFARQHGFPLVVKPNVGGFSRGSHFPIRTVGELIKASLMVKVWWPVSVVERYLEGHNYRVLVGDGEIMSVIERFPPFVDGDGQRTVTELIEQENQQREEMGLFPVMHPIARDEKTVKFLTKQGLTLTSVPAAGQRVTLFNRIALAPGGIVKTIDKQSLPAENRALFEQVLSLFNANILGIDVIMSAGIETDYRQQECILLEVNSRPYVKMHAYPRYGERHDLSDYFTRLEQIAIRDNDVF